jgi:hypothetical protein
MRAFWCLHRLGYINKIDNDGALVPLPPGLALKKHLMRNVRLIITAVVCVLAASLATTSSAQMVGGLPGGMRTFSPVTGAQPFANGMSAQQQQMAMMSMMYGMMGGANRGVSSGVANPFANGGFGMGSQPSLESPADFGSASSKHYGASTNRSELRAQKAEQKRLAKANAAAAKAAGKSKSKKNAAGQQ